MERAQAQVMKWDKRAIAERSDQEVDPSK
jgi:hypothetical protein